jgi:hypothetical protein
MNGRQDAGCNHSLGFLLRKNPKPKNDMDAIFGKVKIRMNGRQDAGCNHSLGFSLRENLRPKSGTEAAFGQRKG